jgi:ssDNA-binding replication factor A large subunit
MFSTKGHALAQAKIKNDSIEKLNHLPDDVSHSLDVDRDRSNSSKVNLGVESAIGNLRFGHSGVSLKARVVKKSEVRAVTSKDGTPLLVCDVTLSDGTGEIPLAVWNSQIGTISQGDLVQIQNARVRSFRGEIQLSLGRKVGVLTVIEPSKEHHAAG